MAEEVRIDLKSTADTSGFDKMGAASKEAGVGLGMASKESKELGTNLGKSVEVGSATTALMQNLGNASKGGAEGMFAAGRAVLSFGQIVKGVLLGAGPIGMAVAALGLLAGGAMALYQAFKPASETIEQFKGKLDTLDKANFKSLDATLSALFDRLKNAKDEADAVRASLDKIDDAEMAAKLADNKGDTKLTDRQKEKQEQAIRGEFKSRRQARERGALSDYVSSAAETRGALEPEFEDARQKYGDLLNERDSIISEFRKLNALYSEASRLKSEAGAPSDPRWAQSRAMLDEYHSRAKTLPSKNDRERLDAELASARNRFQGEDGKGGIAAKYQAAVEEERKAKAKLSRYDITNTEVGKWEAKKVASEDAAYDANTGAAKAAREEARRKQIEEMKRTPESTWRTRAASGFGVDADVFKEAFPQAKPLPQPRTDLKPVTDSLNKAADAAEKAPDPKPAADAADRLANATESSTQAQAAANAAVVSALSTAVAISAESVAATQAMASQVVAMRAQMSTLSSQLAAARQRIAT